MERIERTQELLGKFNGGLFKYSNPPISPVLTPPPRRLSTPEREAKRRRLAAHRALEQHVSETCV